VSRVMTYGETMLRLTPAEPGERLGEAGMFRVEPGGAESNVAVALAGLGREAAHFTRLPQGPLGDKVVNQLRSRGVDASRIRRGGERVGCYWTETGGGPRPSRVIYDRRHSAFADWPLEDHQWPQALGSVSWLHVSGITPALGRECAENLAAGLAAAGEEIAISLDLNYRDKLWGWLEEDKSEGVARVMRELCRPCQALLGNETDFSDALGFKGEGDSDLERYQSLARQAFDAFPRLRAVAISLRRSVSASRNSWSGLLFLARAEGMETCQGREYDIHPIVDRVGAGDAFAAGIIHGLLSGWPGKEIIDFAVTLGALKHTIRGDACVFTQDEVRQVMAAGGLGRVIR